MSRSSDGAKGETTARKERQLPETLLIFLPSLAGGGAERSLLDLGHAFANRGIHVILAVGMDCGALAGEVDDSIEKVVLNRSRVFSCVHPLRRLIQERRPTATLSGMEHANLALLMACLGKGRLSRAVVSVRSNLTHQMETGADFKERAVTQIAVAMYRFASAVVAVSGGVAEDLVQNWRMPPGKVSVAPNPVVTNGFKLRQLQPLPDSFTTQVRRKFVLAAGRLDRAKDYPSLLRAFAASQPHDTDLVILGEGDLRNELLQLASDLGISGSVHLPGFVENPLPIMRAAHVFVLSSKFEGLPGVLIQALACDTPVIATDCPSGPREILCDGKYGILVPVGDDVALATALRKSIAMPKQAVDPTSWQPYTVELAVESYARALGLDLGSFGDVSRPR